MSNQHHVAAASAPRHLKMTALWLWWCCAVHMFVPHTRGVVEVRAAAAVGVGFAG